MCLGKKEIGGEVPSSLSSHSFTFDPLLVLAMSHQLPWNEDTRMNLSDFLQKVQ
jgi:hypothetical protein